MKVGDQIAEIVSRNKDMSTEIVKYSVKSIATPILVQFLDLKRQENIGHIDGVNKKTRSPVPGTKGAKILDTKKKDTEMSRKIKRYNIVELLGKLYDGLASHKSQDEVVL